MASPTLSPLLTELHQQALLSHQRRLLVLIGDADWSFACLNQLPQALTVKPGLWVSNVLELPALDLSVSATLIKPARCHQVLGREFGWVLVDACDGLDPDALGACSGTLRGGGLLILLLPAQPRAEQKPFAIWLEQQLQPRAGMLVVRQDTVAADLPTLEGRGRVASAPPPSSNICSDSACVTEDQAEAVRQIVRVAQGHRHRPLVISADRGRGKSAALGIAAARLIQERPRHIRVTAPAAVAVEPLFERLQTLLPGSTRQGGQVVFEQSRVEFVALDLLLQQLDSDANRCDLLLVDEAAAIPASMLERLLRHHARIVFSTTVHGYEGTGRGFLIRFRQALEQHTPNWRRFELQAPIRWRAGDPLERWIFDALLLDAEPDLCTLEAIDLAQVGWRHWSPQQLLDDPQQLRQLFALLVQAHYRTRPGDLRDLLDDPALQVWLLHAQQPSSQLLGVVLVAEEGGFEAPLADQIWLGKRRPRGHLLPQVLAAQAGWRQAPQLRYWRIVRIAVPQQLRQQGVGSEMIRRLRCEAQLRQVDLLGSSFGATDDLLPFWHAQSMRPLRLGLKADASSGCVSLLYGCGCSAAGQRLLAAVAQRFAQDLPRQLQGANADLESGLVRLLLQQSLDVLAAKVDLQDMYDLYALVFGQRGWEQAEPALYRWVLQQLLDPELALEPLLERVLIYRLVQRRDWATILPLLQLTGARQAEHWLRARLKPLLGNLPRVVAVEAE